VQDMGYRLPEAVAQAYFDLQEKAAIGAVLDVGAGTGLVGEALRALGVGPLEATDICPEMLARAAEKSVYARLFEGDLLARLPARDAAYAGAVSAGTFTHGHVGPAALGEVLRVVRPGGWVVISVNARHWTAQGFEAALETFGPRIAAQRQSEVAIYAHGHGPHAQDRSVILALQRA